MLIAVELAVVAGVHGVNAYVSCAHGVFVR